MTSTEVEVKKSAEAAPQLQAKPLNQTQTRNLTKIIEGDFESLRSALREMILKKHGQRLKEIAAKYGDDDTLADARNEAEELSTEFNTKIRTFEASLPGRGMHTSGQGALRVTLNAYSITYVGNEEAVKRINRAKDNLLRLVNVYVDDLKRAAERKILIASVTGSIATDLLQQVPNAQQGFEAVMQQLGDNGEDDIKELVGDQPIV